MKQQTGGALTKVAFYATPPHPCSYLPERTAVTLFVDPYRPDTRKLHSLLSEHGFRRSGEHLYRPHCPSCQSCLSLRVPVAEFKPRRNQLRTWERNQDLAVLATTPIYRPEYFDLYRKYLATRHQDGGMDNPTPESFRTFLTSSWSNTIFYEFRLQQRLLGIAVVDKMEQALSAVYTFFDPEFSQRSLGRFAILFEIEEARRQGYNWLYLGYWIPECQKMRYKSEYQPYEYYLDGKWRRA